MTRSPSSRTPTHATSPTPARPPSRSAHQCSLAHSSPTHRRQTPPPHHLPQTFAASLVHEVAGHGATGPHLPDPQHPGVHDVTGPHLPAPQHRGVTTSQAHASQPHSIPRSTAHRSTTIPDLRRRRRPLATPRGRLPAHPRAGPAHLRAAPSRQRPHPTTGPRPTARRPDPPGAGRTRESRSDGTAEPRPEAGRTPQAFVMKRAGPRRPSLTPRQAGRRRPDLRAVASRTP